MTYVLEIYDPDSPGDLDFDQTMVSVRIVDDWPKMLYATGSPFALPTGEDRNGFAILCFPYSFTTGGAYPSSSWIFDLWLPVDHQAVISGTNVAITTDTYSERTWNKSFSRGQVSAFPDPYDDDSESLTGETYDRNVQTLIVGVFLCAIG